MASKKKTIIEKREFPSWGTWLWRAARGALWTAIATAVSLPLDWSKPEAAGKVFLVSVISGFGQGMFLAGRDYFSGGDKASAVNKWPL